jgi:N-acetylmuramoyl-L-alanine amidase
VVLGYLIMQTQKRLEAVQSELHKVSENAVQAKARVVDLEQTAAGLKQKLQRADFKHNELQDQLNQKNFKIQQLSKMVHAAVTSQDEWRTRLESMRSDLERAKQSAGQAEAEAEGSNKQVASLEAKLDETNTKRDALQTELQLAHSDLKQLRTELNAARSELVEMRSRLRPKLEDARGKAKQGTRRKEADQAESQTAKQTEKLKKKSSSDVTSPLAEKAPAALDQGSEGRDYLIRTIVFEALGETEIGKAAVASVILNRKRNGSWGDSIRDVVTYPRQFEPWMTRKDEIEKLSPNDARYLNAAKIADGVLAGLIPDPTAGATFFLNPVVVRQRRGGSLPSWAEGDGQPIGRHVFYSPDRGGTVPQRAEAQRLQPTTSQNHFSDFLGAG